MAILNDSTSNSDNGSTPTKAYGGNGGLPFDYASGGYVTHLQFFVLGGNTNEPGNYPTIRGLEITFDNGQVAAAGTVDQGGGTDTLDLTTDLIAHMYIQVYEGPVWAGNAGCASIYIETESGIKFNSNPQSSPYEPSNDWFLVSDEAGNDCYNFSIRSVSGRAAGAIDQLTFEVC